MLNFRAIEKHLREKLRELEKRAGAIDRDLRRQNTPLENDHQERAVQLENDEVLDALGEHDAAEMQQIRQALERIASGTYGTCSDCDEKIPTNRLKALPYTSLCADCAELAERR